MSESKEQRGLERKIDRMLASRPAMPRADFTARTLRRIRSEAEKPSASGLMPFPLNPLRLASAFAAAAALLALGFWGWNHRTLPADSSPAAAEEMIILAEGLNDARFLLDDETREIVMLMAP